jgi:hypothetical protein
VEQQTPSDRPGGSRRHSPNVPGGAVGVYRASALDERGYGVMQFFLGILAVLTGVLTWMGTSAGLRRYRTLPGADWTEFAPSIFLGLLTVLFAGLGIFAAKVNRQRADVAARIAQTPERPWLHFAEWDQGRIQEAPAKQAAVVMGTFAAVWNAVVLGVVLLALRRPDLRAATEFLVFLAIFGLVGLGLIALTVYVALAARKFSPAVFEMSGLPGVLGGWLRGTIQLPPEVPGGIDARVRLVCHRRAAGSSRMDYDVWEAESSARTSSSVPVAFRIPFNLPESDLPDMPLKGTMRVSWLLSISASLPGVDYSSVFDVPVFPTEASDASFVTGSDNGAVPQRDRT